MRDRIGATPPSQSQHADWFAASTQVSHGISSQTCQIRTAPPFLYVLVLQP